MEISNLNIEPKSIVIDNCMSIELNQNRDLGTHECVLLFAPKELALVEVKGAVAVRGR